MNEFPVVDILMKDFLEVMGSPEISEEETVLIREAISIAFFFGMAFTKTDPNLSIQKRMEQAGALIIATQEAISDD